MKHLTVDEIIDFVSISKTDAKSMELADLVNMHIRGCGECLNRVRAFQLIYDELTKIGSTGDFKSFVYKIVSDESVADYEKKTIEDIIDRQYNQD